MVVATGALKDNQVPMVLQIEVVAAVAGTR
jgi:hypothetical protein